MTHDQSMKPFKTLPTWLGLCVVLVGSAFVGCDSPSAKFRTATVYIGKNLGQELTLGGSDDAQVARTIRDEREEQLDTVNNALTAMFGTPDEPYIVADADLGVADVIDPALLPIAAGPTGRDENGVARGLYRQHCVHCHGVTGDGQGPTAAFLNPYPRDFRMGLFKFKSTPSTQPPTDADLTKTLKEGIPGTSMPSFKVLLADDEIEALVNYVKYLSVRGEVERKLIYELTFLEPSEPVETTKDFLIDITLSDVVNRWANADQVVTPVPAAPEWSEEERLEAVARGRELFQGKEANCFSCHGVTALGDGQLGDYDEWTKDYEDFSKIADLDERQRKIEEFVHWGGLEPRNIKPRNLRQGVFRGGRRPIDLYWRIKNGIAGSPMPAAGMQQGPGQPGLTEEDLWDIVAYVQHLPYESISQPPENVIKNLRQNP